MDISDYIDRPEPDMIVECTEDSPKWEDRYYCFQYDDVIAWDGFTIDDTYCGITTIELEAGLAEWSSGDSTAVTRILARDHLIIPATEGDIHDAFRHGYITDHPEQKWKRVRDLVVGDRVIELTREALGLSDDDLPAVIDTAGPVVDHGNGSRRHLHYTAEHIPEHRTQAQGARHNPLALQWVRLADAEDGHHV